MSLSKPETPSDNPYIINQRTLEILNHGLSGALGGCISTFILYPIENIKVRMQAMAQKEDNMSNTDEESKETKLKRETKISAIETLKMVLKHEGISGIYKGVISYVIGIIAAYGIYFFWYEYFRGTFIKNNFDAWGYTKTSFLAGTLATTLTNPIWVINTRILLNKEKKMTILEAVENIIQNEGIGGMFKGLAASIVLVSNPIIQFVIYEFFKKKFEKTKHASLVFFLAGALSKAIATVLTYPYQTLKTNLQANKGENLSQLEMAIKIYKERGALGFFRGLNAKLSQTVSASALMLLIYEKLNKIVRILLIFLLKKR